MKNETLFRDKPVWSAIFSLAIPSCITILIMTIYNMADMFFIGMQGDTAQVAAVSVVSPMFSLIMAAATMLGVGGCSKIASAIGAGRQEEAKIYSSLCTMGTVVVGAFCGMAMLLVTEPILHMLGTNGEIITPARTYMRLLAIGTPFMLFSTCFASVVRAEGAIKEGLLGNMVGTVINIVLDPVLILGLHMGVAGAAIATVLGNVVSSSCYLFYILRKSSVLRVHPRYGLSKPVAIFGILAIGLPNGISSLLSGFASTFSNQLLSNYGTNAIAAMASAGKAVMVITMIQMGICMGTQPLMAYNYAAGNTQRLNEIIKKLAMFTILVGTVMTVACFMARHTLIGLFLKDVEAASMGESVMIYLVLASPLIGIYYLSTNYLQASGKAMQATIVSVLRQGGILIPCIYILEKYIGFMGIAMGHTVADFLAVMIAASVCLKFVRKHRSI